MLFQSDFIDLLLQTLLDKEELAHPNQQSKNEPSDALSLTKHKLTEDPLTTFKRVKRRKCSATLISMPTDPVEQNINSQVDNSNNGIQDFYPVPALYIRGAVRPTTIDVRKQYNRLVGQFASI